jgi:hypothetical protein
MNPVALVVSLRQDHDDEAQAEFARLSQGLLRRHPARTLSGLRLVRRRARLWRCRR